MNFKNILWYLGIFLIAEGLLSVSPIIVALLYHEPPNPFLMGVLLPIVLGVFLLRFPRVELDFGDAMLLSSVALIALSFFGAFPFFNMLEGDALDVLVNGYFESVSAYTTTGLTVLPPETYTLGAENYHSLIFKRTVTEWLGGLGIVVMFLSVLARGGMSSVYLYQMAEGVDKITPTVGHTARIIIRIYLFYTLVGAILLWVSTQQLDFFHSLCAVMSAIATGGFIGSVFNVNSGTLDVGFIGQVIMMIVMLVAAIPFTLHNHLLGGESKEFFKNIEIRALVTILFMSVFLFLALLWLDGIEINSERIFQTTLGVVSVLTTTGYTGGDIVDGKGLQDIGGIEVFLLFIIMVIGAGAGSTGGGIKLIRFSVMIRAVQWSVKKFSLPESAIVPLKSGGRVWEDRELDMIAVFFFLYTIFLALGFFVTLLHDVEPTKALILSASSLGMNGLTGTDLTHQPIAVKITLILQMIAGRLEIFPVLALLGYLAVSTRRKAREEKDELEKKLHLLEDWD